nr:hypothetical protein [Tanacetum cinerariifolium]
MGEPLSPDRVFDFLVDEPEPHPAYDFFATRPLPGYAGNPNNNNGWIEADLHLLGELEAMADEPMVGLLVDEIAEPMVEAEEQVIAPVVDMDDDIAMLFGDDDFKDDESEGFDDEEVWEEAHPLLLLRDNLSPRLGLHVPPSVIEDLSARDGVPDGSGRGRIGACWCLGGAGSADCGPEGWGDCRFDSAGAGFAGSYAAEGDVVILPC